MRREFFKEHHKKMAVNKNIWVVTGDLGYGGFDQIRKDFPKRFINTGAAEQAMMGIAVGLAMEGKIPFVYSITPFLLYRPFETIRNYVDHESIPVKLIGSGRDDDYEHDGFSHFAGDDITFMKHFRNITCLWPKEKEYIKIDLETMINDDRPYYLNLKRK